MGLEEELRAAADAKREAAVVDRQGVQAEQRQHRQQQQASSDPLDDLMASQEQPSATVRAASDAKREAAVAARQGVEAKQQQHQQQQASSDPLDDLMAQEHALSDPLDDLMAQEQASSDPLDDLMAQSSDLLHDNVFEDDGLAAMCETLGLTMDEFLDLHHSSEAEQAPMSDQWNVIREQGIEAGAQAMIQFWQTATIKCTIVDWKCNL